MVKFVTDFNLFNRPLPAHIEGFIITAEAYVLLLTAMLGIQSQCHRDSVPAHLASHSAHITENSSNGQSHSKPD